MSTRILSAVAALTITCSLVTAGCERSTDGLEPYPLPTAPEVFIDTFTPNSEPQAFLGSKLDAVSIDTEVSAEGTASMKVDVPASNAAGPRWSGGAIVTQRTRNLSGYNALSLWAKSTIPCEVGVLGFGNDNTGNSLFTVELQGDSLTTKWERIVIPIPQPDRLQNEGGLFEYSVAGQRAGDGHIIWFDEIEFVTEPGISVASARMPDRTLSGFVGGTIELAGGETTLNVGNKQVTIVHRAGYFDFESTDEDVAIVRNGIIQLVGTGVDTITATVQGVPVVGRVIVTATEKPTTAPPTPTEHPDSVISLFSDVYTDVPVASWSTPWDQADLADITIQGKRVKVYTNMGYAGIEWGNTAANTIDATGMTHFHMDIWVPIGTNFMVKLVDFGADGIYGFAPDSENQQIYNASSQPPFDKNGEWVSLDMPLDAYMFSGPRGLYSREHLAQLIIEGVNTAYIANVYFYK